MNEKRLDNSIKIATPSGNEFGWFAKDLPIVAKEAINESLACLGGQVQFIGQWGTCEAYWLTCDPEDRKPDEIWETYVSRSWKEALDKVNHLKKKPTIQMQQMNSIF